MAWKVNINENCIGCWACVQICPQVFAFNNEEARAEVKWDLACDNESCISDAKNICPVQAIECIE